MHAHRHRTTRSLGLLAAVFLVIGTASTITRIPAGGELHAQTTWRGLIVAPEQRCSPYWGFRSKPITDSGPNRSLIPVQTDH